MVIVAAVDRSDRAPSVLHEADVLANLSDDNIHIIHVMNRSEAVQAEESGASKDNAIPLGELRERAVSTARALIEEHPTTANSKAVGKIGDPATEIINHANEVDAKYIVVSPKRRSQTGKILFGSVAQSVLLNAECPTVSIMDRPQL